MADLYTYDLVRVTDQIEEIVGRLLGGSTLTDSLRSELEAWQGRETGVELGKNVTCHDVKVMSFSTLKQVHEQLKINPISDYTPSLHQLLQGSELIFPSYKPPPKPQDPELVARLEKIQISLDNKEYNKMISKSILDNSTTTLLKEVKLDVRAVHRQMWMIVNFLFTVIGCFVFGYFAAYYAGMDVVTCVLVGLSMGLVVMFADLYFIMKYL